ncbi:MAG: ArgE/DapE family deacylase [Deltaproteobacteria bacterium]|nr:ArgE/DapE family deacylase [Deltaproteobacteria bacterium]
MLSEKEKSLLGLIDENRDGIVRYLRKLLAFRTVTPAQGQRAETGDFLEHQRVVSETLEESGFRVETWEIEPSKLEPFPGAYIDPERDLSNMPVLVGRLRGQGGGRSLILNGHYDVVPPGIVENWKHDPFGAEIEDNRIFGRGSSDMKGGIAAMVQALRIIHTSGIRLNGDVTVEIVPDEEATSMGTLACCQKGYNADGAVIPEPTDMNVLIAVRGNLSGTITVFGRAGHADINQPHWKEGGAVNAISKAAKIVLALEDLTREWRDRPDKRHPYLDPDIIVPTTISGGKWVVSYPEEVKIGFTADFNSPAANLREEIEAQLKRVAAADSWMREHPPLLEADLMYGAEIDRNEPIAMAAFTTLEELGFQPRFCGWGTLTDAIHLVNYSKIPTVSIGPDGRTAHETDEYLDIEQLTATAKALALLILRWCGSE